MPGSRYSLGVPAISHTCFGVFGLIGSDTKVVEAGTPKMLYDINPLKP